MGIIYKHRLFETTALILPVAGFLSCGGIAHAGPTGGNVGIGAADISYTADTTTITQATAKAVINWQSFDTASGETVRFIQPSSDAITLNRIRNGSATKFDGNLIANGNVWIVNPNGVFFGATAKIDVAGLIASTADITDNNFSAGNYKFDIAGKSDAAIINDGDITIREAGLAGFVAPHVQNNGVINARLGKVQLAGTDTATLDLYGDGLIELAVTDKDTAKTIVQNGIISADGGTVMLKAAAGKEITDNIISMNGIIAADTAEQINGKIILSAEGGKTEISGRIHATSGTLQVTGKTVTVKETAEIEVSGITGGGTIRIGGGYQGGEGIYASDFTSIESGAVIKADATESGNGGNVVIWSDGNTDYGGHISARGGEKSGNGGEIEVSGKEQLGFHGTVDTSAANGEFGSLLLDPTDITISNNPDSNVSGTTTRTPSADDVVSNLNVTTLQTALASSNVTVLTRATGSQAGDITVNDEIAWNISGRTLTLNAAHDIIVNAAISAGGGGNLTLTAGNSVALNAALSGTGTLTFQSSVAATSFGVGTGQAGTFSLDDTELGLITNGWAAINIGSTGLTGAINIGAAHWNDPVTFRSGTGTISVNGAQTLNAATNMTFTSNTDVVINDTLTGTGTLYFLPVTASNSMGIGDGQGGTINLSDAELALITNGWGQIYFGGTSYTGAVNIGANTWNDPLYIRTTGLVTINGDQNMAGNAFTLYTSSDPVLNGYINGTGALALVFPSRSVGFGDGQTGVISLSEDDIARFNGWGTISLSGAAINISQRNWTSHLTLTSSGILSFNGAQDFGNRNVVLSLANNLVINDTITAAGALTLQQSGSQTMGIGTGQDGAVAISDETVSFLTDASWSSYAIGNTNSTGNLNIGNITWNAPVTIRSRYGSVNFNGTQNFGNKNVAVTAGTGISINDSFTGTGNASFGAYLTSQTMGIGDGQVGNVNISDTSIANISDGWNAVSFLSAAAMNIGSSSVFTDNTTFRTTTGQMTVSELNAAAGANITLITDSDMAITGPVTGDGTLTLQQYTAATTIGIGDGQAGTLSLTDDEIGNITDGWSDILLGAAGGTGLMNVGAMSWNDNVTLRSTTSGIININGAQNLGTNNLTLTAASNINLNADLIGSGILTIQGTATTSTIGLGTGQGGTINLDNTELAHLVSGWQEVIFGRTDSTGVINIGTNSWNNNTTFKTNTGIITVAGAQDFGANNATFETNGNPAINAALTGSGTLTLIQASAATTIGTTGTLNLTTTELGRITNGWNNIVIGRTDGTGAFIMGGPMTWNDNVTFQSGTGLMTINGIQNFGSNDFTIQTDSALTISAALNGTGTLTIKPSSITTSIGLGGAAGTLNLTSAEMNLFTDGWANILIGRNDLTAAVTINTLTLNDPLAVISNGTINLNGIITSNAGTGTVVTLAGSNIVNSAGDSAINPNTGLFLIYTADSSGNTLDGLTSDFYRYSCSYGGSCPAIPASGNGFLYSYTPYLTVTPDAIPAIIYGDSVPNMNGYSYTVSGYLTGDSAIDSVTGTINGTTSYTPVSNVGSYNIDYASGSLTSSLGYGFTYADNASAITVNKATLSVSADNKQKEYNSPDPALTYTANGFRNAETVSIFTGSLSRVPGEAGGDYSINRGTLDAGGNYTIDYTPGTLTISHAVVIPNTATNITVEQNPVIQQSGTAISAPKLDLAPLPLTFEYFNFNDFEPQSGEEYFYRVLYSPYRLFYDEEYMLDI